MNPYKYSEYFEWLCSIVGADPMGEFAPYRDLLTRLFQTNFICCRYMDENREANGKMLRYYFESNYYDYASHDQAAYHVSGNFYNETAKEPCSMLEMMVSFAKDIDTSYLYSTESRILVWFWIMIEAMGLGDDIDGRWDKDFDRSDVEMILEAFNLNAHQYNDYGDWVPTVAIFPIHNTESYQGVNSLWEQMQVWYNEQTDYLDNLSVREFVNYYIGNHLYG